MDAQAGLHVLLTTLSDHAREADGQAEWPQVSWEAVRRAGVLGWCIPREYGGAGLAGVELLGGYERVAEACLTTCFILSQRDAACRRLRDSGNEHLCRELLPPFAHGDSFATVGLSQLTTSRQHSQPALRAQLVEGTLILDGFIPWVTGAARADFIIIGAVLEDGRQVLAVLPRTLPGVSVGPPLELMALEGSMTAEVRCDDVRVEPRWLLAGPAERVITVGRGSTGGLETSCLGLGLTAAALRRLSEEAQARPELRGSAERLWQSYERLRKQMHDLAEDPTGTDATSVLRARVNSLVLRATQATLTASKGTGFLRQYPAQRWARQALFFLVWSCPRPAAEATLAELACTLSSEPEA
jgi:alkylation response protein AidB-like acyl-CoA dehydrogenase